MSLISVKRVFCCFWILTLCTFIALVWRNCVCLDFRKLWNLKYWRLIIFENLNLKLIPYLPPQPHERFLRNGIYINLLKFSDPNLLNIKLSQPFATQPSQISLVEIYENMLQAFALQSWHTIFCGFMRRNPTWFQNQLQQIFKFISNLY